jgi:hypothetical protein
VNGLRLYHALKVIPLPGNSLPGRCPQTISTFAGLEGIAIDWIQQNLLKFPCSSILLQQI